MIEFVDPVVEEDKEASNCITVPSLQKSSINVITVSCTLFIMLGFTFICIVKYYSTQN